MVELNEDDKLIIRICEGVETPKKPSHPQQKQTKRTGGYNGCFRPTFVRPCANMFRKEPMDMNYAQSAMDQLISQAKMSPEELEALEQAQSEQPEQPKKKHQLGEEMFPAKVEGMPNKSFGSMEDLRKARP